MKMTQLSRVLVVAVLVECAVFTVINAASWGEWGELSGCSKTCGEGLITRERTLLPDDGEPARENPMTMTDSYPCNIKDCPVDGKWTNWGAWTRCNKACGGGTKRRQRSCTNPSPRGGGEECEGLNWEEEECNKVPCPPLPSNFDLAMCESDEYFMCDSGKMCIPVEEECNKSVQCHDGSDEQHCNKISVNIKGGRYDSVRGRSGSNQNEAVGKLLGALFLVSLMLILH